MLVLVWVRTLIPTSTNSSSDLVDNMRPQFPLTYDLDQTGFDKNASNSSTIDFFDYTGFSYEVDIPLLNISINDSLYYQLTFDPINCKNISSFVAPKVPAPIIAVVGAKDFEGLS